jgi:hypothetical protein
MTKIIRTNISCAKNDQYAILRLKKNKTNINHSKVQIMLIATDETTCSMISLRLLFSLNSQLENALLFRLIEKAFNREVIINELKFRIINENIKIKEFSSYNFRKEIAQHVFNNEMLNDDI